MSEGNERRPRESACSTPDCGRKIKYVTGPRWGRWVHADDGRWQCEGYGEDRNRQASPPMEYYRNKEADRP